MGLGHRYRPLERRIAEPIFLTALQLQGEGVGGQLAVGHDEIQLVPVDFLFTEKIIVVALAPGQIQGLGRMQGLDELFIEVETLGHLHIDVQIAVGLEGKGGAEGDLVAQGFAFGEDIFARRGQLGLRRGGDFGGGRRLRRDGGARGLLICLGSRRCGGRQAQFPAGRWIANHLGPAALGDEFVFISAPGQAQGGGLVPDFRGAQIAVVFGLGLGVAVIVAPAVDFGAVGIEIVARGGINFYLHPVALGADAGPENLFGRKNFLGQAPAAGQGQGQQEQTGKTSIHGGSLWKIRGQQCRAPGRPLPGGGKAGKSAKIGEIVAFSG